jgi:GT2 family glycosyltransferase
MRQEKTGLGAVIIGRNEGERLIRCITSVKNQTDTIVYVDSGSSDGSSGLAAELGVPVLQLDDSSPFSAGRARNEGFSRLLELADGVRYVQFIDGDCELCQGWIDLAYEFLKTRKDCALVTGRVKERNPEGSIYNWLCDIEWLSPVGYVESAGGIFFIRTGAFQDVDGFDTTMVAGEEPELCYRLRSVGWRLYSLAESMVLHDAAILRFQQWWKRTVRSGLAYAHGFYLHRKDGQPHHQHENRRILVWALFLPLAVMAAVTVSGPAGFILLAVYPLQVLRLFLRCLGRTGDKGKALWYAAFNLLEKFPQFLGQLLFVRRQILAERPRIIEYK